MAMTKTDKLYLLKKEQLENNVQTTHISSYHAQTTCKVPQRLEYNNTIVERVAHQGIIIASKMPKMSSVIN